MCLHISFQNDANLCSFSLTAKLYIHVVHEPWIHVHVYTLQEEQRVDFRAFV